MSSGRIMLPPIENIALSDAERRILSYRLADLAVGLINKAQVIDPETNKVLDPNVVREYYKDALVQLARALELLGTKD